MKHGATGTTLRSTSLCFEKQYIDSSGVEFGVRLVGDTVEFECVEKIDFPIDQLDWIIQALERIRAETNIGEAKSE